MSEALANQIETVRRFNRLYTKRIGVLDYQSLLGSPFSLAEARVLYELAHRPEPAATELGSELGIDPGYLSRILSAFERTGLVRRRRSPRDGRESFLSLTSKGRRTFATLVDARSARATGAMLRALSPAGRSRLARSLDGAGRLLGDSEPGGPVRLRRPGPGDLGWVIHRHGVLYAREYGWDETFEALVAEVAASFLRKFDPKSERGWIAERNGETLGAVFLVRQSKAVAKLRLLYVEPTARGLGLGARLVSECVAFARRQGYQRIVLWTQSVLGAARHLYANAGFELVEQEKHIRFGHHLVAETWQLDLRRPPQS